MNKKFTKQTDYKRVKAIKDHSINLSALKGLRKINKVLGFSLKAIVISGIITYGGYSFYLNFYETIHTRRNEILKSIESNPNSEVIAKRAQLSLITDFFNMKEFYQKEANFGILEYRYKLISKAKGLVLETSCGAFPNAICYSDLENVTGIIGIDWNKDLLSLASEMNSLNKARFELMNSTDIEYKDNSFDTVVDTFGLQASLYPKKQLDEMIRVCKKGGKILLLEIGESYWNSTNYKLIRNGFQNFTTRGEILFRNWDEIIENYNNLKLVKIVEKKRRINGILYYYELEKI